MNASEFNAEGKRLSHLLDSTLDFLKVQIKKEAEAEQKLSEATAKAWLEVPDGTAAQKEAWVKSHVSKLRYDRDLAAGLHKAAKIAVESRMTQISLLQSVMSAYRAEGQFADRYEAA